MSASARPQISVVPPPSSPAAGGAEGPAPQGLNAAFEALAELPALFESRRRVLEALEQDPSDIAPVIAAVESDVALAATVLRAANRPGMTGGPATTVPAALEALGPVAVHVLLERVPTVDVFDRSGGAGREAEAYRRHAVATQAAVRRVCDALPGPERPDVELLCTAALLHDVGKLALVRTGPAYAAALADARGPLERLEAERRRFGIDHAAVGGVLLRRWGLPRAIVRLVERHHADDVSRDISVLRLADLVAHHGHGEPVAMRLALRTAERLGLTPEALRGLVYDQSVPPGRRRTATECPLSSRETDVLRGLAHGGVYKEIADRLGIAPSTVRTHLHNIYAKLDVSDRAQAVLLAVDRGWIAS
jgi:putative nucleotidyltransferase with HDIG domain